MYRLFKNNKLLILTVYSSYLYPLVQVLRSVLDPDLFNKPHHLIVTCTVFSISSSSFLPTIMCKHHLAALAPNMLCMLLVSRFLLLVFVGLHLVDGLSLLHAVQTWYAVRFCGDSVLFAVGNMIDIYDTRETYY